MLYLVTLISTEVDNLMRRIPKFLRLGNGDVQTAMQAGPYGIDSNPVKDMIAVYGATSEKGKTVIIGYINKNALAEVGGTRLFSTDESGAVQATAYLRSSGDMELNGDADNMVRFSKLEEGFNTLKGDVNTLITTYNSHIHITTATVGPSPTPGVISPTTSTGTPTQATIASAKIENVKTN